MIVCKTIYEFIDYYVNGNKYFLELTFEDDKLYKELFDYCNANPDGTKLVLLGELYENGICVEKDERCCVLIDD